MTDHLFNYYLGEVGPYALEGQKKYLYRMQEANRNLPKSPVCCRLKQAHAVEKILSPYDDPIFFSVDLVYYTGGKGCPPVGIGDSRKL